MSDQNQLPSKNSKSELWYCEICQYVLGMVEGGEVLHIKRKDLYVEVRGGSVTVNCYRCGKRNTLAQK